jgi:hypothetical protein
MASLPGHGALRCMLWEMYFDIHTQGGTYVFIS